MQRIINILCISDNMRDYDNNKKRSTYLLMIVFTFYIPWSATSFLSADILKVTFNMDQGLYNNLFDL